MAQDKNNPTKPMRILNQELIDKLYTTLSNELSKLLDELNSSAKMGAYGAAATLSSRVADIASDLKKLQHLPNMLTNPFILSDPREILDEINKKYSKKTKKSKTTPSEE